jgi:hypothetical protein
MQTIVMDSVRHAIYNAVSDKQWGRTAHELVVSILDKNFRIKYCSW